MKKRTFGTLQAGRGLAALGVVFYHAATYAGGDPRYWRHRPYYFHFEWCELGVEYFFVLSGVVIMLAHWRDQGVPHALPTYLWKRFRRVYPIYWCILALVAPTFFVGSHLGHGFERNPWVLLSSVLLIHIHSHETTLNVAWTLFHEILFYAFFAGIVFHRRIGYFIFAIWQLGSLAALLHWISSDRTSGFFSPLHLLFGLGMIVAWTMERHAAVAWKTPILAGFFVLVCISTWSVTWEKLAVDLWLPAGVAFSLITLGLMELERQERVKVWRPLGVLGAASYSIYLVHFAFMSLTYRISYRLDPQLHMPLLFWISLNVALATAFGILVYYSVERPLLNRLGRKLTGGFPAENRNVVL